MAQTTGVETRTGSGNPMENPKRTPALADMAAAPTSAARRSILVFMVFCVIVALRLFRRASNRLVTSFREMISCFKSGLCIKVTTGVKTRAFLIFGLAGRAALPFLSGGFNQPCHSRLPRRRWPDLQKPSGFHQEWPADARWRHPQTPSRSRPQPEGFDRRHA